MFKGTKTLKSVLMHPKIKSNHTLNKTLCTNGLAQKKIVSFLHTQVWQMFRDRIKDTTVMSSVLFTNTMCATIIPKLTSLTSKIIDQDKKQVTREARKAIHIENNNPASTAAWKKYIPEIFNKPLGAE